MFFGLLLVEFLVLDRLVSRNFAWVYPRWNDQIQYLTESYTGYEYLKAHGFFPGLWQTLINPSAQGTLHDFFAVLIFAVAGPSRSAALSVNLFYLLAWQAALFFGVIKTTGSRPLAFAAAGLLLALNSPWWGGPGSAVDFRLDWMACCAMGIALSLALCTEGFRSTRWSLAFGAAVGFVLLTRFLTGAYFAPIFAVLLCWCLAGGQRWRRSGNLLLAAIVAFALAAPFFWLNRDWVYNYYLIGHFTGPESAIRSPNMGITRSISWLFQNWWSLQFGVKCAWLVLAATAYLIAHGLVVRRLNRGQPPTQWPNGVSGHWGMLGVIFFLGPALVLTLHSQKSELVLSIMLPGAIVLVLGLWHTLGTRLTRTDFPAGLGWGVAAAGIFVAVKALALPAGDAGFLTSARKVNTLADYLYATQLQAKLDNPRVGVDQVTDSLDGQIMRVLCYERHMVWVPFIMTLPTGIMEEKPEVLMERLAQSDFMFLTDAMPGEGPWPYDREMRRLYPQLKAWCDHNLKPVESFPLFGRQMMLYQRRDIPELAGHP
jgi:hypothetical protein